MTKQKNALQRGRPGRKITIAGEVLGSETKLLGKMEYPYPLLSAKQIYLWPRHYDYYYYGYPYPIGDIRASMVRDGMVRGGADHGWVYPSVSGGEEEELESHGEMGGHEGGEHGR